MKASVVARNPERVPNLPRWAAAGKALRRSTRITLLALAALLAGVLSANGVTAKDKDGAKDKKAASGGKSLPPGVSLNACGCYKSGSSCVCTDRKAKCECPGDCEPVGCEEKRQKDIEKEYAAEVKRAQEEDKKRKAAEEAAENGADTQASADDKGDKADKSDKSDKPAKPAKPAKKPPAEK